tara:strand:- start:191 stop:1342 length:1152 start_codon:yes stop_codon:yes gene_type:complete
MAEYYTFGGEYNPDTNTRKLLNETFPNEKKREESGTTPDKTSKGKIDYDNRGGLPKTLRYPFAAIQEGMDFLKMQIATFTPSGTDLDSIGQALIKTEVKGDKADLDGSNVKISAGDGFSKPDGGFGLQTATDANTVNTGGGRALKNPKHTIYLPIPRQIQDANSVQYDSARLDPLEAVGAALIQQGIENPSIDRINETVRALTRDGVNVVEGNVDAIAAAIAGRAIGALGGNVTANQLIARASGAILNPNLESLFQGVKLRQFPFTFEFFPRNYNEGQQVKMIIKVLKRSMAARNNKKAGRGIFIKQPDIFQLQYMKGSGEHPFLNKFLPMHLTDMKINYSQSGTYSTFYDGTPTHMTVSCSFQEVNPVYQEDYDEAGAGVGY